MKSRFSFDAVETMFRSPISFSVSPSLVQFVADASSSSSPSKESSTAATTVDANVEMGVLSPLITANSARSAIHADTVPSAEQGDDEGSGFYGAAATAIHSPTVTPGRPIRRRKADNTIVANKCESNKDSENYFDLVRTSEIRSIAFPLWIVWFASGFAYYGIILFVARLYSTTTDDGGSCSFDYSSIFINATAEVGS